MPRVAWLTDIHLNFCTAAEVDALLGEVVATEADAVILSGDIGEATDIVDYLRWIDRRLQRPVYFVLGNHDFYFGSIGEVRAQVSRLCAELSRLVYLTDTDVVSLTPSVALVGHDGWADGRLGDYERSFIMMNDYKLIAELAPYDKRGRLSVLNAMGDEAGAHIRRVLPKALQSHAEAWLVTHVPPLREACWHQGRLSDDEWAPHFTCKAVGDAILDVMRAHPTRRLTVLCGHTHGSGQTQPLPNVTIWTGGAEYQHPRINQVFDRP